MPTLSSGEMIDLLLPFASVSEDLADQLSLYLDLLLRWNERTNLTSIRDGREIVRRHFGESLFTASCLPPCKTLLDFGSGAGFPGIPIQLARPELRVTLAESQNKKSSFLREVVRLLDIEAEVWPARVDTMPRERSFDVVTLRAVDNPTKAIAEARKRVVPGGSIVHLTVRAQASGQVYAIPKSYLSVVDVMIL